MPFLRDVHESLHVPAFWGSDRWGYQFMGIIALVWLLDSFVALYLTLPLRRRQAAAMNSSAPASDGQAPFKGRNWRSEEPQTELQSLMRHSHAVFCVKNTINTPH